MTGHWQFQCPRCGFGHVELGRLAADSEIYCEICCEEEGLAIALKRWLPPITLASAAGRAASESSPSAPRALLHRPAVPGFA
jgi:hypothetical protein